MKTEINKAEHKTENKLEKKSEIIEKNEKYSKKDTLEINKALNVGIVGHIDHGKTTLLYKLTGVWADKHSEELKRGITIKLGYADITLYECPKCKKISINKKCSECGEQGIAIKNISFVDAPGHEMLMATMLGGAAMIDAALLVIAANEYFPQPQTKEHLLALDIKGVKNIIILQNKVDLITKEQALLQYQKIKEFTKGTIAENAEIIPVCAQQGLNIDEIIYSLKKIKIPERDTLTSPLFLVARTFDINRPGTDIHDLKGGVLGGTLRKGILKEGDIIEIKPGMAIKKHDQTEYKTVETKILGLKSMGKELESVGPFGLIAVQTTLDPIMTKADLLSGCIVGLKGTLPNITNKIRLKLNLFDEIVTSEKDKLLKVDPLKTSEYLLLSVNTSTTVGLVTSIKKDITELSLKIPIVPFKGDRVGIARNYSNHWRLIGWGEILD